MTTPTNTTTHLPLTGLGIGWRPEIAAIVAGLPGLGFCELIAESVPHIRTDLVRALSVPAIAHGIGLSLGGVEPVTDERIDVLGDAARVLGSPLVSEHIAFVRADGVEAGHLLPVPRSRAALEVLVDNVTRAQDRLPVPLAVENIASVFDWPDDEYTEGEFLTELVERTGVYLLVDVANVYACAINRGLDPGRELDRLPVERIAYCHVAGGEFDSLPGGAAVYHDTHTAPVPPQVLELVTRLAERSAALIGHAPPFMLERDGDYPPAGELLVELDAIADAAGVAPITVGSPWRAA